MQVARTEHTLSLVYGLPTIIGGVNGDQFISSIEQFDKETDCNICGKAEMLGVGCLL